MKFFIILLTSLFSVVCFAGSPEMEDTSYFHSMATAEQNREAKANPGVFIKILDSNTYLYDEINRVTINHALYLLWGVDSLGKGEMQLYPESGKALVSQKKDIWGGSIIFVFPLVFVLIFYRSKFYFFEKPMEKRPSFHFPLGFYFSVLFLLYLLKDKNEIVYIASSVLVFGVHLQPLFYSKNFFLFWVLFLIYYYYLFLCQCSIFFFGGLLLKILKILF